MRRPFKTLGQVAVGLTIALVALSPPALSQSLSVGDERAEKIAELLEDLSRPNLPTWEAVEDRLIRLWSQSGSDTADLLLSRGENAIDVEDYATAIEHLTALTDHAPDFAEGWHMRATAFYLADEHGLAVADLQRALILNPNHFSALTGLGIILEDRGDYIGALAAFEHAQTINPHREMIQNAVQRVKQRLGRSSL